MPPRQSPQPSTIESKRFNSRHDHIAVHHETFDEFRELKHKRKVETDDEMICKLLKGYQRWRDFRDNPNHVPSLSREVRK